MKYKIKDLAKAIKNDDRSAYKNYPAALLYAYIDSIGERRELIDFGRNVCLFDYDVAWIAGILAHDNVREFTISSGYSGIVNILYGFEQCGFKLAGLVKLDDDRVDVGYRPAFKLVADTNSLFWLAHKSQ